MESINLILSENNNDVEIDKLAALLSKLNANVEADGNRLTISYEYDDVARVSTRNAGRKPVVSKTFCTLGDVENMLLTMSGRDVAKELGISKSLFYEKLKKLREQGERDSLFE